MTMTRIRKKPALDRTTVEFARSCAPDKSPDPDDTEREVWMKAGASRLVSLLETILAQQENHVPQQ